MKKPRLYASLAVITVAVLAFIFVPLPHSIICVLEVQARDAEKIYVVVAEGGRLAEVNVEPGDRVEEGQQLAQLENLDVDLEIAQLTGKQNQYDRELRSLARISHFDRRRRLEIPAVKEALNTITKQLVEMKSERSLLRLQAPIAGIVLPPDSIPAQEVEGQLSSWSGTPFERKNLNAHLQEGVMFCQIGDPNQLEAMLVIDQTDVEFVRELYREGINPKVEIKLDELPHDLLFSQVVSIAEKPLEVVPRRLATSSGGELPSKADPDSGRMLPQGTFYPAHAPLGLYGHDPEYGWLRGRLEFTSIEPQSDLAGQPQSSPQLEPQRGPDSDPDSELAADLRSVPGNGGFWSLRYASADGAPDAFGGRITLADTPLMKGYEPGDYVTVSGKLASRKLDESALGDANLSSIGPSYQVTEVRRLADINRLLQVGLRGRAKIHTKWQPLGTRLWRLITHVFNFKL